MVWLSVDNGDILRNLGSVHAGWTDTGVVRNMDRALLAHFLLVGRRPVRRDGPGDRAEEILTRIVERLPDQPAMVFSRYGQVLLQTRPAIALFGDYTPAGGSSRYLVDRWLADPAARERYLVEVGAVRHHHHLRRYRHTELGELELYRQLLVSPENHQILLVYTTIPGSASAEKLRLAAAARK